MVQLQLLLLAALAGLCGGLRLGPARLAARLAPLRDAASSPNPNPNPNPNSNSNSNSNSNPESESEPTEWGQSFIGQDVCGSRFNDDPFATGSNPQSSWEVMKRKIEALEKKEREAAAAAAAAAETNDRTK